jgi:hypothetical protein
MADEATISVRVIDENGDETSRDVLETATLADVVPSGRLAILNGKSISLDLGKVQLRAGDVINIVRKSGKAA